MKEDRNERRKRKKEMDLRKKVRYAGDYFYFCFDEKLEMNF